MKSVTVVYSPLCVHNGAFLGQLKEWLNGKDIEIHAVPFNRITTREMEWYRSAELLDKNDLFKKSVFFDVFFEGKLIDTVPLKKKKIEKELEVQIQEKERAESDKSAKEISISEFRDLLFSDQIEWVQIDRTTFHDEMKLCIENYPYGNPPERFHQYCIKMKEKVFAEVFTKEDIAGIFARWQGEVIGLLEVFPREIIRQNGYLAGSQGKDKDYLTVGCFEVGFGVPRKEMIDELMFHLEASYPQFHRHLLEGVGMFEWNIGFTPYWVYDKYGFHRTETIIEAIVVMEKMIHERGSEM